MRGGLKTGRKHSRFLNIWLASRNSQNVSRGALNRTTWRFLSVRDLQGFCMISAGIGRSFRSTSPPVIAASFQSTSAGGFYRMKSISLRAAIFPEPREPDHPGTVYNLHPLRSPVEQLAGCKSPAATGGTWRRPAQALSNHHAFRKDLHP
jgi:hypothetical protein